MTPPRLRVGVVVLLAVSVVLAGASTVPGQQVLVVTDDSSGERLVEQRVEDGTAVEIEYTHSVEKTEVLDAYTVRDRSLETDRMEFESYGAGLPSEADVERTDDGRFVFYPNETHDELAVSLGAVAGHTLTVGDRSYDLLGDRDRRTVTISVERRTVTEALIMRLSDKG